MGERRLMGMGWCEECGRSKARGAETTEVLGPALVKRHAVRGVAKQLDITTTIPFVLPHKPKQLHNLSVPLVVLGDPSVDCKTEDLQPAGTLDRYQMKTSKLGTLAVKALLG
jgi:hypothetical protein